GQLTLLKRPVEARLKNFELLKEQKEFAERTNASRVDHNKKHNLRVEYEENKRKNVSQLMKEFDNLYKEGKYVEAESMAVRAKELDPDNSVVTAAVHIAKMKSRQNDYQDIKDRKESEVLRILNDSEDPGDAAKVMEHHGISIDQKAAELSRQRKPLSNFAGPRKGPQERAIEQRLTTP